MDKRETWFKKKRRLAYMVYICKIPSPAGQLTLSSNGKSITGLWIEGQKYYGSTLDRNMLERIGGGAWKLKEPEEVPGLYEENEELPVFDEALSRRAVRSGKWYGRYYVKSHTTGARPTVKSRRKWRYYWEGPPCRPRPWAGRWDITPSPS